LLHVPHNARTAFKKEIWASVVVGVMAGAVGPYIAFVASHRLHCSSTLISLMLAAPWFGGTLCLVWASAMEGKSTMRFVVNSWVVARVLVLLMVFAVNPYVFAAIVIAYQFISTICAPGYTSIMRAIYPDDHRGKLMGYVRVAMMVVATVTTLAVGPILKQWDWSYRAVFPIAAVFGIVSALMFKTIHLPGDNKKGSSSSTRAPFSETLSSVIGVLRNDKRYAWYILTTTVYGFGNFLATPAYPKFMDEVLRMDEWTVGIYSTLYSVVVMLSYLFWGHYVDRRSPVRCTAIAIFFNSLIPLVFLFSTSIAGIAPRLPVFVWILPGAILTGIMVAGLELAYFNSVLKFAPHGQEMVYQSVQSGVQGLRGIAGPVLGGVMYDLLKRGHHDVRYVFLISFVLIVIGWSMLVFGRKDLRVSE
jgi:MFS family permease